MPHKVNPIDFENSEGNIGLANSLFDFLSNKLPKSRLQRDLSDSTVLRNIGVPFGHSLISFESILRGLNKIYVNEDKINKDIEENWIVVSEAIQTILRREGYSNPYEIMKELTRNNQKINKESLHRFIDDLKIDDAIKKGIDLDGTPIPPKMIELYNRIMNEENKRERSGVKKSMRNRCVKTGSKHFNKETLNQLLINSGWEGLKEKEILFFYS